VRKEDILRELGEARADLLDAIDGLSADHMRVAGVVGVWSVKDVLAHIVAWASEVVTALNQIQLGRVPSIMYIDDIDEWNDEQYHINARRPLEAILDDLAGVHRMLDKMLEGFDERTLTDNRRYPWMEGESLVYLLEENVYLHEREHADEIREWRDREGI
jgi:uncharacterized damage-inducible protein DinB